MRNTYALINLKNLEENIKEIKNNYSNYDYYFGVIKANAYGHGFNIVKTLTNSGINYLAVSSLEEALKVRKFDQDIPILIFGYVNLSDIEIVEKNNLTLTILSYDYYKEIKELNSKIKVHLKVNTGMNRFGINNKEQIKKIFTDLKNTNVELEGIYTHLATSGVYDKYYDIQIDKFKELTSLINLKDIKIVHLFNSLSLARHDKLEFANGVRLGLMMYGFSYSMNDLSKINKIRKFIKLCGKKVSNTNMKNNLKLKKVLSLYSEVVNINQIKQNDFVGYNALFKAKKDSLIAIVPIGHGDGVTSSYKEVIINDKEYDIVGYCMDYIMVLVDSKVKLHDKVTLINDELTVGMIANNSKDNPQHILVSISDRVERRYE